MKICPTCHQTYKDDSLNFCLNDGSLLNHAEEGSNQQTVYLGQPRQTNDQPADLTNQQGNWNAPRYTPQVQKKSRAWMWVVGVVGGVIVLMVVGFIGLIGLALTLDNTNSNANASNSIRTNSNSSAGQNNSSTLTDDFSGWRREVNEMGASDYKNGEFIVNSKLESNYYVLMTRNPGYTTSNAATKVTVRNVENKSARYGFGLAVKVTPAKSTRYVFLIDDVRQSYRVVLHLNNKENTVVNWTKSTAIRNGSQSNELEVRDEGAAMKFFINGQSITTIRDSTGIKDGLAGIYASGAVPIAFSNLQITK